MFLRSLTLDNFGVYKGSQTIQFSTAKARPITLIGGSNGAGKTSLLESIPLCLYGNLARRIRDGNSYPSYLNSMVHFGERDASISLEFDRLEGGCQVRYVVRRTWHRTIHRAPSDQLCVHTDGTSRPDLVSIWPEFVEGIMPMALSELTFFDSEKVESLADPASSAKILRTSIHGLLGLDVVDRLLVDLQEFRRRVVKSQESKQLPKLSQEISQSEKALAKAEQESSLARLALADAQGAESDLLLQLQDANDELARSGGELLSQRDELHRRLAEAEANAIAAENELVQLASGDLPLSLVSSLLKQVASAGEQGEASHIATEIRSAMAERDYRIAESLASAFGIDGLEKERVRNVLQEDLESIMLPDAPAFSPSHECTTAAHNLLSLRSNELQLAGKRLTSQLEDHKADIQRLDNLLAAIPEESSVASILVKVATAEANLRSGQQAINEARAALDETERRVLQAKRDFDAKAHDMLAIDASARNSARLAREITSANDVLTKFSNHMVSKHIEGISVEIGKALALLLHKETLAAGVTIDPKDLTISLLNAQQEAIDTQRLSAGERQVMATAVLFGLSLSTGKMLPTIIDTPVGRLDNAHRQRLIEHYFPNASRQVVLLSTDEEIVGTHLQLLRPHVGIEQRLVFDEERGATTIERGYFDE